jgi:hypothetical protein
LTGSQEQEQRENQRGHGAPKPDFHGETCCYDSENGFTIEADSE